MTEAKPRASLQGRTLFITGASRGITDLEKYSVTPGTKNFIPDFFVDL